MSNHSVIPAQLEIEVESPAAAFEEEPIHLLLKVKRPDYWNTGIVFRNISTKNKSLHIDVDYLDRQMELRPGETCHFTVPITVHAFQAIALEEIFLEIADSGIQDATPALIALPKKLLVVRPSIGKTVRVSIESICKYPEGTKVALKIKHHGSTPLTDVTVNLSPEKAIWSGKRVIQLKRFEAEHEENIDLVLMDREINVSLAGNIASERADKTFRLAVEAPPKLGETWYRFLHPSRPFDGQVEFQEVDATNTPIRAIFSDMHSCWPLQCGVRYQIVIRSKHGGFFNYIRIRDIPGVIVVRSDEEIKKDGSWKFTIDVISDPTFCTSEVLIYDVANDGNKEIGEIPIRLLPQPWKHWKVATILGATMTLQGATAITKFIFQAEDVFDLVSHFKFGQDYNLLFLLIIPLFWIGLKFVDWIIYRFQS